MLPDTLGSFVSSYILRSLTNMDTRLLTGGFIAVSPLAVSTGMTRFLGGLTLVRDYRRKVSPFHQSHCIVSCAQSLYSLPGKMYVAASVYLEQFCTINVANLDERCRNEQQVWWVKGNRVWPSFPLDGLTVAIGLAVAVHVHAEC